MLCPKCHNKLATVRYAEVVDGQVTEKFLCPDCLAKLQGDDAKGFEFSGPAATARTPSAEEVVDEAVRMQRACPSCGTTLSQLLEENRLGCASCYQTFAKEIEPRLEEMHHSLHHKGKAPRHDDTRAQLRADLQSKRTLLRSVLRAENYEEAARLRDEIRSLETGLYVSESGAD